MTEINGQCDAVVRIGLTELEYLCVLCAGHDGPHQIAISSEFDLADQKHDVTGLFGKRR